MRSRAPSRPTAWISAREAAEWYARTFPDRFYLELQDNGLHGPLNDRLCDIGRTEGLPVVATNDCHYLHRDDAKAHEVLLCIQTGKTMADESRWRFDTDELYVKTPEGNGRGVRRGLRSRCATALTIANRIDFEFEFGKFHFPIFRPDETAGRIRPTKNSRSCSTATCATDSPNA